MPLDIRQIKPFVHTHEKMMWDSLVEGLKRVYKEDNRPHILLGNFSCERQFDALYLSPRGICIIELKSHSGQIHAPQNGEWFLEDRMIDAADCLNPLDQVQQQKFALIGRIKTRCTDVFANPKKPNLYFANGRVVFNAPLECEDRLDESAKRWFQITDLESIPEELADFAIDTFLMSDRQILRAAESITGNFPPVFSKRILHVSESDFSKSQSRLSGRQGDAQTAKNLLSGFLQQIRNGRDPLAAIPHADRDEIGGLRSHKISDDYLLLVIHLDGKNYLALVGTADEVEEWISSHAGFVYTVDTVTGRLQQTRVGIQDAGETEFTEKNIPFVERIKDDLQKAKITTEELLPVAELNELTETDDRESAYEQIEDLDRRILMKDVVELLRIGREAEAAARINLFTGRAVDVADAPELHEAALESIENSDVLLDLQGMSDEAYANFINSIDDEKWMYFLHPGQERVAEEDFSKPVVLTGVSGSGKTAVLMHRARRMALQSADQRILILALNKSLASMISMNMGRFCPDIGKDRIRVISFHEYLQELLLATDVRQFLLDLGQFTGQEEAMRAMLDRTSDKDLPKIFNPLGEDELRDLFRDFTQQLEGDDREVFNNLEIFLFSQNAGIDATGYIYEEMELLRSAFPCYDDYTAYLKDFQREGRSIGLQENRKKQILRLLKLWERYQIDRLFLDHMGLTQAAYLAIKSEGRIADAFRYRSVLVDEFQDFSNLELEILAKIPSESENGLFLTGDYAQKLYAKQLNLREAGLSDHIPRRILRNYRNTRQILLAADSLLLSHPMPSGQDADGAKILRPEYAKRESAKPAAYQAIEPVLAAWRDVALAIGRGLPSQSVCIISANTDKYPLQEIIDCCPQGLEASELSGWASLGICSVAVSDITSVKGFEFRQVFIVGLEEGVFPAPGRADGELWRDAQRLYVAITRGRDEVRFYHEGDASRFIADMGETITSEVSAPVLLPPPAKVVSEEIPAEETRDKETIDAAPAEVSVTEAVFDDDAWYHEATINGLRFLTFRRAPNQIEISQILHCTTTQISNRLFADHHLALRPDAPLTEHLVKDLCHKAGFIAEFRGAGEEIRPMAEVEVTEPPVLEVILPKLEMEADVPEDGIVLGSLTIGPMIREFRQVRFLFDGEAQSALTSEYPVTGPGGFRILVHDLRFDGGDRHFNCGLNETGKPFWERIVYRLRQGAKRIVDDGTWVMDLRQAQLTRGDWSNRFSVSKTALEEGAELDVFAELRRLGANVGTKADVFGETNRTRNWLCARFADDNAIAPLAAYVMTTLMPLRNGIRHEV